MLRAVPAVGPHRGVRVHLSGYDADVEVVLRALGLPRAPTQRVQARLVRRGAGEVLADAEQRAGLLALAPKSLK